MATPPVLRVVLCSYPGVFSALTRQILCDSPGIELVGCVYSARIFTRTEMAWQGAIRLVRTSGLDYALMQFAQTDLYRFLTVFADAGPRLPALSTKDINSAAARDFLTRLQPDVLLLANFNQKVGPAVCALPTRACWNIHPGLLPDFRGVDPVFAALNAGVAELGVSVHEVAEQFDCGDLIAQAKLKVIADRSVFYHQFKLFSLGATLAARHLADLHAGVKTWPQTGAGRYDGWPDARQINAFKKRGGSLMTAREFYLACRNRPG